MRYLLILFLAGATSGFAQNTLLYEISGNGLKKTSYFFGTMHVQNEEVFTANDKVYEAIMACDQAAFELNLTDLKALQSSLKDDLVADWQPFVMDKLVPVLEISVPADSLAARLSRMIIPIVTQAMELTKNEHNRADFVDLHYQNYATKLNKEIIGIETVTEQLNLLKSLDQQVMVDKIVAFAQKESWNIDLTSLFMGQAPLIEAYAKHDLKKICSLVEQEYESIRGGPWEAFYDQIFEVRNKIMFERTSEMVKKNSVFIAVGSGHLCGETGLIQAYRNAGYTVTAVNISDGTHKPSITKWVGFSNSLFETTVPYNVDSIYDEEGSEFFSSVKVAQIHYSSGAKAVFTVYPMYSSGSATDWDTDDYSYVDQPEDASDEYSDEIDLEDDSYYRDEVEDDNMDYDDSQPVDPGDDAVVVDIQEQPYLQRVTEALSNEFKPVMMMVMMQGMKAESTEDVTAISTKFGERNLVRSYNSLTGSTATCVVVDGDGNGYKLVVSGDKAFIDSETILPFFKNFKLKKSPE
jgi:uncharacterized protein YbaP (TraB family)